MDGSLIEHLRIRGRADRVDRYRLHQRVQVGRKNQRVVGTDALTNNNLPHTIP
jgi:hypothetical protein